ncbi:MAG TPA: hypothetical protein VHX40_05155, partial [Acidimicrobiales bacterium]|nr:hypothetical protein [Acidimicrobiales bacterium]
SGLTIGGAVRIADLRLPSGVTTDLEEDAVVVSGQPPRLQAAGEGEGEAGEAAEGAEASAATESSETAEG